MSEAIIEVLPDFWAAAIVNGDETGMDDDDSRAFNAWIKEFQEDNGVIFTATVFSDEAQFVTYHHANLQLSPVRIRDRTHGLTHRCSASREADIPCDSNQRRTHT